MKIYYTGAIDNMSPQNSAEYSLGGYAAVNEVPNSMLGNLFASMSNLTIERNQDVVVALALKNDEVDAALDLTMFIKPATGSVCKYEIGVSAMAVDSRGQYYGQKIQSMFALPYGVEFHEAKDAATAINVGTVEPSAWVMLWIKRKLIAINKSDYTLRVPVVEEATFNMKWSEDESQSTSQSSSTSQSLSQSTL